MKLPEPDYLSMEETVKRFDVSIEHLRWLAENLRLPVYVKTASNQYAVLNAPRWELDKLASDLPNCMAIYFDKKAPNSLTQVVYTPGSEYSEIFIKRKHLIRLEEEHLKETEPTGQPRQESVQALCQELKANGLSDKAIAKKLKERFPYLKYSHIGKLLPAKPGCSVSYDAERKRGARLLK